ncbi:MAG: Imm50 family immunity protein [Candidatus Accumulibacter sp.]|nr:Imm50 family immunity protein [Accumulibacter sp.]MDS4055332.1 Imm50 family immunity protein [Accumulibacter sp.]
MFKTIRQAIDSGKVAWAIEALISMCAHLRTHEPRQYRGLRITILGERMTTSNWTDSVLDAAPVRAIFGPSPPSLEGIDLHEINLHRDGPRVLLRFDLQDFPVHPPRKWAFAGFNRVQMRLIALGVQLLEIAGLQSNMKIDLSINKEGPLTRVCADNGTVRLELTAEFLIVDSISAYCDGASS